MPSAQELQRYLSKRGYQVEVSQIPEGFTIGLTCKTTDEIAKLLATIGEGGKFIITVNLSDLMGYILGELHMEQIVTLIHNNELKIIEDEQSTAKLKEQNGEAISSILNRLDSILDSFNALDVRIKSLERKQLVLETMPWWKRFFGVKYAY